MTQEMIQKLRKAQPILVVDDSVDDFEATKRALAKVNLGNPVVRATCGDEALDYLSDTNNPKPGLILLDLNMPGLDGRKTLAAIKKNNALKRIPVVILTTSDDDRDVSGCYEMGANTYIQKPVDFDGLISAIKELKEYWFSIALLPKEADHE